MSVVLAFQAAVTAALAAAPDVVDRLGDRVFDETPASATTPYAYFGAVNRRRREEAMRAWVVTARLFVVTDEFGRSDAWAIADAIADALEAIDETELPIEAPFVAADIIRATQSGDVVEAGSDKIVFVDLQTTIEQH